MQSNQGGFQHRYLRLADLRRLEQMLFAPRRIVEGRFSGHFQTRQRGQSIEFRDYREYLPGDEISAIDWKAYGRTDKLFIRLFEHQSELTVQLLVDGSASMAYSASQPIPRKRLDSKYDYACRLAASIGFLVMKQHDRFAFGIAQQGLKHFLPADGSMRHLSAALKAMESHRPKQTARLSTAIDELSRAGRRRSLLVLMSDLLDESDAVAQALAARIHSGGEAVVFHILHPDEVQLPADLEHATFIDSESGGRVRLSLDEIRTAYTERMQTFLSTWESRCRSLGIDYIRAITSEPYFKVLERYLIGRAGRGTLAGRR